MQQQTVRHPKVLRRVWTWFLRIMFPNYPSHLVNAELETFTLERVCDL